MAQVNGLNAANKATQPASQAPASPKAESPTSAKRPRFMWQKQSFDRAEKKAAQRAAADDEFCSIDVHRFDESRKAQAQQLTAPRPQSPARELPMGPSHLERQHRSPLIDALHQRAQQHRLMEQQIFRQQVALQLGRAQKNQFEHEARPVPPVPPLPEQYRRVL